MLVEGDYLSLLPWQDSIEAINQAESKTNCIGTHTKAHAKASKYGVRSGWWKAKRRNPKSSVLLRVGKVQKSSVKVAITINTEKCGTHTRDERG